MYRDPFEDLMSAMATQYKADLARRDAGEDTCDGDANTMGCSSGRDSLAQQRRKKVSKYSRFLQQFKDADAAGPSPLPTTVMCTAAAARKAATMAGSLADGRAAAGLGGDGGEEEPFDAFSPHSSAGPGSGGGTIATVGRPLSSAGDRGGLTVSVPRVRVAHAQAEGHSNGRSDGSATPALFTPPHLHTSLSLAQHQNTSANGLGSSANGRTLQTLGDVLFGAPASEPPSQPSSGYGGSGRAGDGSSRPATVVSSAVGGEDEDPIAAMRRALAEMAKFSATAASMAMVSTTTVAAHGGIGAGMGHADEDDGDDDDGEPPTPPPRGVAVPSQHSSTLYYSAAPSNAMAAIAPTAVAINTAVAMRDTNRRLDMEYASSSSSGSSSVNASRSASPFALATVSAVIGREAATPLIDPLAATVSPSRAPKGNATVVAVGEDAHTCDTAAGRVSSDDAYSSDDGSCTSEGGGGEGYLSPMSSMHHHDPHHLTGGSMHRPHHHHGSGGRDWFVAAVPEGTPIAHVVVHDDGDESEEERREHGAAACATVCEGSSHHHEHNTHATSGQDTSSCHGGASPSPTDARQRRRVRSAARQQGGRGGSADAPPLAAAAAAAVSSSADAAAGSRQRMVRKAATPRVGIRKKTREEEGDAGNAVDSAATAAGRRKMASSGNQTKGSATPRNGNAATVSSSRLCAAPHTVCTRSSSANTAAVRRPSSRASSSSSRAAKNGSLSGADAPQPRQREGEQHQHMATPTVMAEGGDHQITKSGLLVGCSTDDAASADLLDPRRLGRVPNPDAWLLSLDGTPSTFPTPDKADAAEDDLATAGHEEGHGAGETGAAEEAKGSGAVGLDTTPRRPLRPMGTLKEEEENGEGSDARRMDGGQSATMVFPSMQVPPSRPTPGEADGVNSSSLAGRTPPQKDSVADDGDDGQANHRHSELFLKLLLAKMGPSSQTSPSPSSSAVKKEGNEGSTPPIRHGAPSLGVAINTSTAGSASTSPAPAARGSALLVSPMPTVRPSSASRSPSASSPPHAAVNTSSSASPSANCASAVSPSRRRGSMRMAALHDHSQQQQQQHGEGTASTASVGMGADAAAPITIPMAFRLSPVRGGGLVMNPSYQRAVLHQQQQQQHHGHSPTAPTPLKGMDIAYPTPPSSSSAHRALGLALGLGLGLLRGRSTSPTPRSPSAHDSHYSQRQQERSPGVSPCRVGSGSPPPSPPMRLSTTIVHAAAPLSGDRYAPNAYDRSPSAAAALGYDYVHSKGFPYEPREGHVYATHPTSDCPAVDDATFSRSPAPSPPPVRGGGGLFSSSLNNSEEDKGEGLRDGSSWRSHYVVGATAEVITPVKQRHHQHSPSGAASGSASGSPSPVKFPNEQRMAVVVTSSSGAGGRSVSPAPSSSSPSPSPSSSHHQHQHQHQHQQRSPSRSPIRRQPTTAADLHWHTVLDTSPVGDRNAHWHNMERGAGMGSGYISSTNTSMGVMDTSVGAGGRSRSPSPSPSVHHGHYGGIMGRLPSPPRDPLLLRAERELMAEVEARRRRTAATTKTVNAAHLPPALKGMLLGQKGGLAAAPHRSPRRSPPLLSSSPPAVVMSTPSFAELLADDTGMVMWAATMDVYGVLGYYSSADDAGATQY